MQAQTTDGARISYEVSGSGDHVLLIMGFASDRRMWLFQVPALSDRYAVITYDHRGIGESSGSLEGLSMEAMAADALAVLDAAGAERAHVVGISMGGAIAQHLALAAPDRVRSLVLASTWCARNTYLPRLGRIGQRLLEALGHSAVVQASMLWLFTPRFLLEQGALVDQAESMAEQFAVDPDVFLAQQRALLEHHTVDRLAQVQAPTLIMVGERDIFVPPELSEQIAAAMPRARFERLPGGHAYNVEEFQAFNDTVRAFLDEQ